MNNENVNILYIHTKGVCYNSTHYLYNHVNDWIDMMLYFLVEKYDICLDILNNDYDTIGCNYSNCIINEKEITPPHYSGNFWWSNTNYISNLPKLDDIPNTNQEWYKNQSEFWILRNININPEKHYTIHNSNINHYNDTYNRNKYILNEFQTV